MPAPQGNDRPASSPRRALARDPAARRVGRAFAELLAVVLLAVGAFAALLIWHLARRGRVIRDRLGPPRPTGQPPQADDGRIEDRS